MKERVAGIYQITVNRGEDSPMFYIGQSYDVALRLRTHRSALDRGTHFNAGLQAAFDRYGSASVSVEMLCPCAPDKETLRAKEQEFVDAKRRDELFNVRLDCVVTGLGTKASVERKAKIAAAIKGLTRSVETRAKIGAAQAWKKTEEGRAKLSAAQKKTKKKISPETRAKLSAAHKGRKMSPEAVAKTQSTKVAIAAERGSWYSPEGLAARAAALAVAPRRICSDEQKMALSAANRGRKHTPEACKKIGDANRGREACPEGIAKRVAKMTGRKQSPEHVEKGRQSRIGTKRSPETKLRMREAQLRLIAKRKAEADGHALGSPGSDTAD